MNSGAKTMMAENTLAPTKEKSTSRIDVCYLIDGLAIAGTEKHLCRLINSLDRSRYRPVLVLLNGSEKIPDELVPQDCKIVKLGIRSFKSFHAISEFRKFVSWLKSEKVEVLQMYFPDSMMFGSFAGWLARVPLRIRTRRNAGYAMSYFQSILCRLLISPFVTHTIANSEASGASVIKQEKASPTSVTVITNGVNLERFDFAPSDYNTNVLRFGMVANLRPVKRVQDFVVAASMLLKNNPDCEFEIAGGGSQREELERLVEELGMRHRFSFVGSVSDIPAFLSRLHGLVSCSEQEGLSNAILEAMAARVPVVASNCEGNQAIVKHEKTGLLYPIGDTESLYNSMQRLIVDHQVRNNVIEEARAMIEEDFDQEKMVQKYQSIYDLAR